MSTVFVEVRLPDWLWWELACMADPRGVKVADVVADAIWAHVLPLSQAAREHRIAQLHEAHYSVAAISRVVGLNREAVANVLRRVS